MAEEKHCIRCHRIVLLPHKCKYGEARFDAGTREVIKNPHKPKKNFAEELAKLNRKIDYQTMLIEKLVRGDEQ